MWWRILFRASCGISRRVWETIEFTTWSGSAQMGTQHSQTARRRSDTADIRDLGSTAFNIWIFCWIRWFLTLATLVMSETVSCSTVCRRQDRKRERANYNPESKSYWGCLFRGPRPEAGPRAVHFEARPREHHHDVPSDWDSSLVSKVAKSQRHPMGNIQSYSMILSSTLGI